MTSSLSNIAKRPSMQRLTFLKLALVGMLSGQAALCSWEPVVIPGTPYPHLARFARLEGIVVVECRIDQGGKVIEATPISGQPVLAKAATTSARQWQFKPSGSDSNEQMVRLTFEFRFQGTCKTQCCNEQFVFHYPDRVTITSEMPHVQEHRSK